MPKTDDAMNAFVDEQILLFLPFANHGRFNISEDSFRGALKVAYCMGGVRALTQVTGRNHAIATEEVTP